MQTQRTRRHLIPIKQAILEVLAFGLLAASFALFFVAPDVSRPFFAKPVNLYRIIIMALAIICLLLASRSSWLTTRPNKQSTSGTPASTQRLNKLLTISSYLIPTLALLFAIIQLVNPELAIVIIRKESWPFYRIGIFVKAILQIIALLIFVAIANHYRKQHNWLAVLFACLVIIILFVMAGEELSWGQRIFGWATPEVFANLNKQGETNFHNMATQVFQNTLYFGGWLLLVGFSFWRNSLDKLLRMFKPLRFLTDWLPPLQFVLIFAACFGFGDPLHSETGLYYGSNLFIVIATGILLIALCLRYAKYHDNQYLVHCLAVLAIYLVVLIINQFFSLVWDSNSGAVTEYLEVFISIGILMWAIAINSRVHADSSRIAATSKTKD